MKQSILKISENKKIAKDVYLMKLTGEADALPGQFINIKLDGFFLRRPISVCDANGDEITIIYKTVGHGTEQLSRMNPQQELDVLSGLGNGFDLSLSGNSPLVIGGGVGVPPMYYLAKCLVNQEKNVTAVLGFNSADDVFGVKEFEALGVRTIVATADGSFGEKGFVTDVLPSDYTYFYTCGPEPMLKAVYEKTDTSGQLSFEERMGCGFGACMGCSCKTKYGNKRICKDGPVLQKEEIIW